MITHNLIQSTPEWHAHRSTHFNASDAPAMMGCSSHKTRTQLLHEMHTGLTPEVDAATQRRFDEGHRFEALARPLAEKIIGEDLYPVTGSMQEYSASFDGLTMMEHIAFEHKSLNDDLRSALSNGGQDLPLMYRVQMEQQCMVSSCERVLFMASQWTGDELVEERHCWYLPDQELRAQIGRGWVQFKKDLAAYVPTAATPVLVAEPVQSLPAVLVQVSGEISIRDNFPAFEVALRDFLEHRLIREPKTDQDFADLDSQIKAMKGAEEALASAETQMLAQVQSIDQAKKTKDMLTKLVRDNRLMAEKLLASEKDRRRAEIVAAGGNAFADFVNGLNVRLGKPYMPQVHTDFPGVIKGMKSMTSMENAVATELARTKIEASATADRIEINLNYLREHAKDYAFLFADTAQIVLKAADDFQALVQNRITSHKAAEAAKEEATRERIRAEEQAKAEREAREKLAREKAAEFAAAMAADAKAKADQAILADLDNVVDAEVPRGYTAPVNVPSVVVTPKTESSTLIRLGQINECLAPISITADGLAQLGFTIVTTDKSAKMYRESDLPGIFAAMIRHILAACHGLEKAA